VLLVVANTINIAADLAAMGESLRLVIPGSALLFSVLFGVICLVAEVFVPYHSYAGYLKFLALALLCYVAAAFSISVPWLKVLSATFIPDLHLNRESILVIVAVFGTTISPYLFFWQASQEAEEARLRGAPPKQNSRLRRQYFSRISTDTWTGMVFSNLIAFFIIVTTAATLSAHGITHIDTASQAAEALRPIAGNLTFALFSTGIIGTGLLAVPVLAGSAAYAVAESFNIQGSLELPANRALGFYGIVSAATLTGAAIPLTHIDPIAMLFWSAVINGVIAVPIMIATMHVVSSHRGRRTFGIPQWLRVLGWMATVLMAITVAAFAWLNL
jgi:Mn2+/Fe2+ NRAMP family transporter